MCLMFFIKLFVYIYNSLVTKTDTMRTQRDNLKDQANALEAQLTAATKYGDGIDLMDIYRKLDKVKSLIEAIR